jgi:diguanylate cyclase (GGDEF)-like protein
VYYRRYRQHPLRWITVVMHFVLGLTLLTMRHAFGSSEEIQLNLILLTIYLGCCLYFWNTYNRATTGSIITIGGFFAWAMVFVVSPLSHLWLPTLQVESEIWNLPKYVVAVGMMLLLLEKQIERSQYLALHDDLTRLANRRLFKDRLEGAIERAKRSESTIALLQVDLDRFKDVNDTYGHHVGDLLLQHVARLLEGRVRRSDTVARTGGDEFSLILEEPAGRLDAELVAASLIRKLSEPLELAGAYIQIGASIGFSIYPEDAKDAESLSIEADLRMYNAKQTTRDFRSDTSRIQESQALLN